MTQNTELFIAILPWVIFIVLALLAKFLINTAKKRKGLAVALGMMAQMFLPDPQVEKTIEIIAMEKGSKKEKGGQREKGKG
ncbi:hypothetical protein AADZ91_11720 [Colwelliaceae bacterium 6441]